MAKKIELKTSKNDASVEAYINGLEPETYVDQGHRLDQLFQRVTGLQPSMWGGSIIGYGEYTYQRANGAETEFMATGFAMRKSGPVLYIMPGYSKAGSLLKQLGPHKLGKSCLYIKRLEDVDQEILARIIQDGLADLKARYPVNY